MSLDLVEASVLGAVLMDPDQLPAVRALLPSSVAFADARLGQLYAGILSLADRREPIDHVTLRVQLEPLKITDLDLLLSDLIDHGFAASNAGEYARLMADTFRRRCLTGETERLTKLLADPALPVETTIASAVARLAAAARPAGQIASTSLTPVLLSVLDEVDRDAKAHRTLGGLTTGLHELDLLTDGLMPGDVLVLAARPSEGKTSLALNRFARTAAEYGPVHLVSREMPDKKLAKRLLQAELGKNLRAFRDPFELDRWVGRLSEAAGVLGRLPIHLDCGSATPAQVRFNAQCLKARAGGLALIMVDYLQLLQPDTKESTRDREIGQMSAALKRTAVELDVPVVILSQLTRNSAKENRAPELFDLRDSGTIEQDADLVGMLHWPNGKAERGPTDVDFWLRKNRDGEQGKVCLSFETWTGRWRQAGGSASDYNDGQYQLQQSA